MSEINFFLEEIDYSLASEASLKRWINQIIKSEGFRIDVINYILCSDEYLLKINREYLNHDTLTDIITFDQSDDASSIAGDIFISIERVMENSKVYGSTEFDELCRVLIHGVLHLLGYKDKTHAEKNLMRKKEQACLSLR